VRTATILLLLTALLIAAVLVASGVGPYRIPPQDVLAEDAALLLSVGGWGGCQ